MRRTAATAPARPVGPCITLASSSTSPCSFGSPPSPTESSFGSFSTTVTAATTASSVSPPAFKMSIPLSSACNPFALEMISGRFPGGAGESGGAPNAFRLAAPSVPTAPKRFATPATAPPASDVRKNFRRDHTLIGSPPLLGQYSSIPPALYPQLHLSRQSSTTFICAATCILRHDGRRARFPKDRFGVSSSVAPGISSASPAEPFAQPLGRALLAPVCFTLQAAQRPLRQVRRQLNLKRKIRGLGEKNLWLGGLDSNQDSQIQSLESCQLDDLPAGGTKTNRGTFPLIGTATILLI